MGAALTACAAMIPAQGQGAWRSPYGRDVRVEVVDAWDRPLYESEHRGSRWIEGRVGERYSVIVRNLTGRRVEAVVSIDGRDVVSGQRADYRKARGYVLEPWGHVRIDGFRRSLSSVAEFRFAPTYDSYAARRGTPQDVGSIGVAVFRERGRRHYRRPPRPMAPARDYDRQVYGAAEGESEYRGSADAAGAPAESRPRSRRRRSARQGVGTAYGADRHSSAHYTRFRRQRGRPHEVITIRYDDYEGLRRRGVLPEPPAPAPWTHEAEPFPESPPFAPPPPPRWWR